MMKSDAIKVELKGSAEFKKAFKQLSEKAQYLISAKIAGVAENLKEEVQKGYKGAGSGIVYYRIPGEKYMTIRKDSMTGAPVAFVPGGGSNNLSLSHQASKPGDPPARDTGGLGRSVYAKQTGKASYEVGILDEKTSDGKTSYKQVAFWLEHGTQGGKIQPRPNWVPKSEQARKEFEDIMRKTIALAIKEAGR